MGKFVSKQSKVGQLINSPWQNPGGYVRPEVTLAVVSLCLGVGTKEIGVFKSLSNAYWRRCPLSAGFRDEVGRIQDIGGDYKEVSLC